MSAGGIRLGIHPPMGSNDLICNGCGQRLWPCGRSVPLAAAANAPGVILRVYESNFVHVWFKNPRFAAQIRNRIATGPCWQGNHNISMQIF